MSVCLFKSRFQLLASLKGVLGFILQIYYDCNPTMCINVAIKQYDLNRFFMKTKISPVIHSADLSSCLNAFLEAFLQLINCYMLMILDNYTFN